MDGWLDEQMDEVYGATLLSQRIAIKLICCVFHQIKNFYRWDLTDILLFFTIFKCTYMCVYLNLYMYVCVQ